MGKSNSLTTQEKDRLRRRLEDEQDQFISAKSHLIEAHENRTYHLKHAAELTELIRNGEPHREVIISNMKDSLLADIREVNLAVESSLAEIDQNIKRLDVQIDECRTSSRTSSRTSTNPYGSAQKPSSASHPSGWQSS